MSKHVRGREGGGIGKERGSERASNGGESERGSVINCCKSYLEKNSLKEAEAEEEEKIRGRREQNRREEQSASSGCLNSGLGH